MTHVILYACMQDQIIFIKILITMFMVRKERCVDNMNANNMDVSKSVIAPYDENLFLGNDEENPN